MTPIDADSGGFAADWPAPPGVCSRLTTRRGGVSQGAYASFNLGDHVGDDPLAVAQNRARLARCLPAAPTWLHQVHGTQVVELPCPDGQGTPQADAALTRRPGVVCAVLTADCLPVLFCDRDGSVVAAAHAGWRGLQAGVLEATVAAMACPASRLMAFLGPAIGSGFFEVGDEVRAAFVATDASAQAAFHPLGGGQWLADLYHLARRRLQALGLDAVFGGGACTFGEPERFFSYRRDRTTGRMASLIWIAAQAPES